MNSETYFEYIENMLTLLSYKIGVRNCMNLNDINIFSEDFFMHLLNKIFGWNLQNANTTKQNIPGIDLIYENGKIVVQISSTITKDKVQSSLDKLDNKYNGYHFIFISISKDASKLREKKFSGKDGIAFDSTEDIYDYISLLNIIKELPINNLEDLYLFIRKELSSITEELKKESGISYVINELAKKDLDNYELDFDIDSFDINKKIIKNDIAVFKDIIYQYAEHCTAVQKIYDEFDKLGKNKSTAVLQRINKVYLMYKGKYVKDDLYLQIAKNIKEQIAESNNIENFNDDDIEMYVDIVLVDAFIRCKIFEKP